MIETNELILRHATKEDAPEFVSMVTKPAYTELSPFGNLSAESANQFIDSIILSFETKPKPNFQFWTVIDKKTNTYAGYVGYQPVVFENKEESMYFTGFVRKFWGTQIPLHSAVAACKYAFNGGNNGGNLNRMIAMIHPDDVESLYIAQTLGCHFEKECRYYDATFLLFSLIASQIAEMTEIK